LTENSLQKERKRGYYNQAVLPAKHLPLSICSKEGIKTNTVERLVPVFTEVLSLLGNASFSRIRGKGQPLNFTCCLSNNTREK